MTKIRTIVLIAAAAAAGALLLNRTFAAPGATTKPAARATSVAVCDVLAVLTRCERARMLSAKFSGQLKNIEQQAKQDEQKLRDAEQSLEELAAGTAAYERQYQAVSRMAVGFDIQNKTAQANIKRKYYIATLSLYKEITDTVAELAKQRGIDIVIYRDGRALAGRSIQDIQRQMSGRKVLYAAGELDITDEVLKKMNAAFVIEDKAGS